MTILLKFQILFEPINQYFLAFIKESLRVWWIVLGPHFQNQFYLSSVAVNDRSTPLQILVAILRPPMHLLIPMILLHFLDFLVCDKAFALHPSFKKKGPNPLVLKDGRIEGQFTNIIKYGRTCNLTTTISILIEGLNINFWRAIVAWAVGHALRALPPIPQSEFE